MINDLNVLPDELKKMSVGGFISSLDERLPDMIAEQNQKCNALLEKTILNEEQKNMMRDIIELGGAAVHYKTLTQLLLIPVSAAKFAIIELKDDISDFVSARISR